MQTDCTNRHYATCDICIPNGKELQSREPAQYRKKPVHIEAIEFRNNNEADDLNLNQVVEWIRKHGGTANHNGTDIFIETLEGAMTARVGDFIIRGVKGEHYPCRGDIFRETYEPVR